MLTNAGAIAVVVARPDVPGVLRVLVRLAWMLARIVSIQRLRNELPFQKGEYLESSMIAEPDINVALIVSSSRNVDPHEVWLLSCCLYHARTF